MRMAAAVVGPGAAPIPSAVKCCIEFLRLQRRSTTGRGRWRWSGNGSLTHTSGSHDTKWCDTKWCHASPGDSAQGEIWSSIGCCPWDSRPIAARTGVGAGSPLAKQPPSLATPAFSIQIVAGV